MKDYRAPAHGAKLAQRGIVTAWLAERSAVEDCDLIGADDKSGRMCSSYRPSLAFGESQRQGTWRLTDWAELKLGVNNVFDTQPQTYAPNVQYVDALRKAAKEAEQEELGLWATDGFACLPVERRRGSC